MTISSENLNSGKIENSLESVLFNSNSQTEIKDKEHVLF